MIFYNYTFQKMAYFKIILISVYLGFACFSSSFSQSLQPITLEDIWQSGKYFGESAEAIKFAEDDHYYYEMVADSTRNGFALTKNGILNSSKIVVTDATEWMYKGETIAVEDFQFSPNEELILLQTATERIYRRSTKCEYFIFDIKKKLLKPLSEMGKQSNPTFSPESGKIAFSRNNNLFVYDVVKGTEIQITTDGEKDKIINGSTDWVYEEEFEFAKAFFWSPDGKNIVFYKFDETLVPQYDMQIWAGGLHPQNYQYKYPKAGENNAIVKLANYNLASKQTKLIPLETATDSYIPRVQWTGDNDMVAITKLNRAQNHLELYHAKISDNSIAKVYEDKNATYIEINDHLTYLKNNTGFVVSSERSGFRHLYHYSMTGKLIRQITTGAWEIDKFLGINEATKTLYYTSTELGETERQLYAIGLDGKNKKQLTQGAGFHEIEMSPNLQFYTDQFSTLTTPIAAGLYNISGKKIKELVNNEQLKNTLASTAICKSNFFKFKTDANIILNAFMIEPLPSKVSGKYPVLIYLYGGPGSQEVKNEWMGPNYAWFQMLAQMGYGVMCVDGRGTGGRGEAFKKCTQNNLGKLEMEDLAAAARYLATLPQVDKNRIGVFGWSFGGYMASLAMTVGADLFKMGIAVAPVISWRFYDTIYTERFLGLPKDNADGYDLNSPLSHASKLKGAYLLVHGTADDNVHLQNAIEMERALIKEGKQFTSFHYPDKNHGIYGGNTRLHLYQMMTDFIKNNL